MKHLLSLFLSIVCFSIVACSNADVPRFMDQFLWQKRPLILFTTDKSDNNYKKQKESIHKNLSAMKDRDMVLIEIIDGKTPDQNAVFIDGKIMPHIQTRALFKHFNFVPEQEKFRLLLIGKDGGTKFIKDHFVEMKYILSIIDSMPMRRQEMKKNKN